MHAYHRIFEFFKKEATYMRKTKVQAIAVSVICAFVPILVYAQNEKSTFPNRPLTIVVPFAAGGFTDAVTRMMAQKMQIRLKQPVIVENRPGAGSLLALNYVRGRPADGYTIVVVSTTITTLPWLNANAKFTVKEGFTPIAGVARGNMLLAVNTETKIDSVSALVEKARMNPASLNWGVAGNYGFDHLAAERIMRQAGVKVQTIAYQGDAMMRTDLVSNRVQIAMSTYGLLAPHIAAGKLRVLAVSGGVRSPEIPDVPTLNESGYKDLIIEPWFAAFGPHGLPSPILQILNQAISDAVQTPEVAAHLSNQGFLPMVMSAAQISKLANDAEQNWGEVIKAMGINPQ